MMKLLLMCSMVLILSACCPAPPPPSGIEYREVIVTPQYRRMTIINEEPIDMTTTQIDYY